MAPDGALRALADLTGAFVPLSLRDLASTLEDRLDKVPARLNEYGYDPFGMSPAAMRRALLPAAWLYRTWFRVETAGIDRVPEGRVLLVANHAGQLPFDGSMLAMAMLLEAEPPRLVRGMGEYWIPRIPWFNILATRGGQVVGTPESCQALLEADECVMVFPEGVRGISKPYRKAYRLQRFGLGFMRLALETGTPIVPVGIVGSEEQQPAFANLSGMARMLGMPALPVTPTFPWLGPLGLLPLPVKYRILFGAPLRFEGEAAEEDHLIEVRVEAVRTAIAALLERGLRERRGVFR